MKIQIIVKTKARETKVVPLTDSVYEVYVTALPIRGQANQAVIVALADHFHLHKSQVEIIAGFTRSNKVALLSGL